MDTHTYLGELAQISCFLLLLSLSFFFSHVCILLHMELATTSCRHWSIDTTTGGDLSRQKAGKNFLAPPTDLLTPCGAFVPWQHSQLNMKAVWNTSQAAPLDQPRRSRKYTYIERVMHAVCLQSSTMESAERNFCRKDKHANYYFQVAGLIRKSNCRLKFRNFKVTKSTQLTMKIDGFWASKVPKSFVLIL